MLLLALGVDFGLWLAFSATTLITHNLFEQKLLKLTAINKAIADQVRTDLAHLPDTHEIKMYGGIAFMVNNKMCVCVGGSKADNIMVRVGADAYEDALKRKDARPTIMKDRPIKGYIDLDSEGRA